MTQMKTRIYSILTVAAAAAITATAAAQNLEESVTVEGKYTPEIIKTDRLPLLPTPAKLEAPESRLEYDQNGVNANFAPDALPMGATAWRNSKNFNRSKGYVDLRVGSWLNTSLSAGVAAINTADTKLGVALQHNSTSLWQAWKKDANHAADAAKRFRYDERINIALSHRVADAGVLSADVQYHLGYFNYYGTSRGVVEDGRIKAPTQTLNDVYASAGWTGNTSGDFSYSATADVRHFAYRAYYAPTLAATGYFERGKGERETAINLGGALSYRLNGMSGLEAEILYSGVLNSIGEDVNRFKITPAYTYGTGNFRLRLGMELAVVGAEKTQFRIAPDIRINAREGIFAFTAAIGGGTDLRTLAWMHNMDFYANPLAGCTHAAYSPIDARLGVQLNPAGKWTVGVEGSWRTALDESLGGAYLSYLNGDADTWSEIPTRLHGLSVAINAGYDFCKEFSIAGKASWQPQHGRTGVLNGFDRPTYTAGLTAESRPIDRLKLALDYNLRACRELLKGNISRLNLTADFMVNDRLSVGAELNNLLNRHESMLPGVALEGFNAAAGLQIIF